MKLKVRSNVIRHGTDNPVVRRMSLQFFDLLQTGMFEIPEDRSDLLKAELLRCMEELLHLEDTLSSFLVIEDEHVRRVTSGEGLEVQEHGIGFDDPTAQLSKLFGDFLIRSVMALRRLRRAAELMLGVDLKDGKALRNHLLSALPMEASDERAWIDQDNEWIKDLIDWRGEVEHEAFRIGPFDVDLPEAGGPIVQVTTFPKTGQPLREVMRILLDNVFTHCEDTIALLFNLRAKPIVAVVQLPEEEWEAHQGFRYVMRLRGPFVVRAGHEGSRN